ERFAGTVSSAVGVGIPGWRVPEVAARAGAALLERVYGAAGIAAEPFLTRAKVDLMTREDLYDTRKARERLGWRAEVLLDDGAAHATGDVLLFLDDDILPVPEFLHAHLEVHEQDGQAVALGALPHPDDQPRTPFLYYLERVLHYDLFLRYGSAERIPLPPLN